MRRPDRLACTVHRRGRRTHVVGDGIDARVDREGASGAVEADPAVGETGEPRADVVGEADAPGRAGGDLLAGDEAVVQPAQQGAGQLRGDPGEDLVVARAVGLELGVSPAHVVLDRSGVARLIVNQPAVGAKLLVHYTLDSMDQLNDVWILTPAEAAKGATKKIFGRATGNTRLRTEGRVDQFKGNTKQAGDKVNDAFKH